MNPKYQVGQRVQAIINGVYTFTDYQEITRIEQYIDGSYWYFFDCTLGGTPEHQIEPEIDFDWDEPMSMDEFIDHINEAEDEKDKPDRYQYCGRRFYFTNKKTGDKSFFTFACGDFRNCGRCCKFKADEEKRLVQTGLEKEGKNLVVTECSQEAARYLCRQQRDDKQPYRRYTLPSGNILVLHCDEAHEGDIISNELDFADLPFDKWIREMPKGKKVSGSGSMKKVATPKPDSEVESVAITLISVWTDAPKEVENKCWQQASDETEAPKDWTEVEKACNRRTIRFRDLLEQAGFVIYCVFLPDIIRSDIKLSWGVKEKILKL